MIYKATVNLFIDVGSEAEACDAVGEILREHLQAFAGADSALVDWGYHDSQYIGGHLGYAPVPATAEETAELEYKPLPRESKS